MKTVKLNTTKDKLITHTITIFSGYYKLTNLEQRLLGSIVKYYLDLISKTKDQDLINKNFLDASHRTSLVQEFNMKQPQLSKYLQSLISKKTIKEQDGTYILESKFIPSDKIMFEFNIVE